MLDEITLSVMELNSMSGGMDEVAEMTIGNVDFWREVKFRGLISLSLFQSNFCRSFLR